MSDKPYKKRLEKVYAKLLKQYGLYSTNAVAWNDVKSQFIRFSVVTKVANLNSHSLLDVGSGLGDLYSFLQGFSVDYTGIEVSHALSMASKEKYPGIHVINDDFITHTFNKKFDWVVSSGTFNAKVSSEDAINQEYLYTAIQKMFTLSIKGISFNLLTRQKIHRSVPFDKSLGIYLNYQDPESVVEFCQSFSPRVVIKTGYLPYDFTIYAYKSQS